MQRSMYTFVLNGLPDWHVLIHRWTRQR